MHLKNQAKDDNGCEFTILLSLGCELYPISHGFFVTLPATIIKVKPAKNYMCTD